MQDNLPPDADDCSIECFTSEKNNDSGDYTLSRRKLYDDLTMEEVFDNAAEYMEEHPLSPEAKTRLEKYRDN